MLSCHILSTSSIIKLQEVKYDKFHTFFCWAIFGAIVFRPSARWIGQRTPISTAFQKILCLGVRWSRDVRFFWFLRKFPMFQHVSISFLSGLGRLQNSHPLRYQSGTRKSTRPGCCWASDRTKPVQKVWKNASPATAPGRVILCGVESLAPSQRGRAETGATAFGSNRDMPGAPKPVGHEAFEPRTLLKCP